MSSVSFWPGSLVIMDDWRLPDQYARENSEEAFRALADRYAGMVYHSALRQLRDPHKAEEKLRRRCLSHWRGKPGVPPGNTAVSGPAGPPAWRSLITPPENRRRRYMKRKPPTWDTNTKPGADTESVSFKPNLSPLITDDALSRLSQADRDAIVIRFFEDKSHKEVGESLGMSEETARRRVSRAVEKLRASFARQGIAACLWRWWRRLATIIWRWPTGLSSSSPSR